MDAAFFSLDVLQVLVLPALVRLLDLLDDLFASPLELLQCNLLLRLHLHFPQVVFVLLLKLQLLLQVNDGHSFFHDFVSIHLQLVEPESGLRLAQLLPLLTLLENTDLLSPDSLFPVELGQD